MISELSPAQAPPLRGLRSGATAAREAAVGGQTSSARFGGGARTRTLRASSVATARGEWMARITSAARSHFPHAAQSVPPARLRTMSSMPLGPAQMGQTKGIRTGTFVGSVFDIPYASAARFDLYEDARS